MTETNYLKLKKPAYGEPADIEVINANMDAIDAGLVDAFGNAFIPCAAAYDATGKRHTLTPVQAGLTLPDVFTVRFTATAAFKAGDKVQLGGVEYTPAYTDSDGAVAAGVWQANAEVNLTCRTPDAKVFVGKAFENKVNQRGYLTQAEFDALDCDDAYTGCISSGITGMPERNYYNVFHMPLKGTPGYGTQFISNVNKPGELYLRQSSKNGVWWSPVRIATGEPPLYYPVDFAPGFASSAGFASVISKDQFGLVHIELNSVEYNGAPISGLVTILTLPLGFKPKRATDRFAAISTIGALSGARLRAFEDGTVQLILNNQQSNFGVFGEVNFYA